jgi:hypothetical protein
MANSETIDQIISDKALAELDSATDKVALLAKQFNDLLPSVAALNAALGGNQSLAAFNKQLQQSAIAQERLTQATIRTAAEQNKQVQAANRAAMSANQLQASSQRLTAQTEREAAARQRATQTATKASLPYQQLVAEYNKATQAARDTGVIWGATSNEFKEAAAAANKLRAELDAIDQPLGNYQRNVGNYASAFQKGFSYLRTAANILPGLGISGILMLGYDAVKSLIEAFAGLPPALQNSTIASRELASSFEGGEYAKAVSNVNELRENIKLAKEGFLDKDKVVKEYNETIGQTTGQVHSLEEAEKSLQKNADAYIKFTLYKAAAQVALNDASKKAVDAAKEQQRAVSDLANGNAEQIAEASKGIPVLDLLIDAFNANDERATAFSQNQVKRANSDKDQLLDIAAEFQKKAAEIAKDNKFDFFGSSGKDFKQANTDALELAKQRLEYAKESNLLIFNDENKNYEVRVAALRNYEQLASGIVRIEEEIRLREIGLSADKQKSIQLQSTNELLKIRNDNKEKQNALDKEITKKALDEYKKQYAALTDAEKQRLLTIQDAGNARALALDTQSTDEEAKVTEQYKNGEISYKLYQKKLKDVQTNASLERIDSQIEEAKKTVEAIAGGLGNGVGDPKALQSATDKLVGLQNQRKKQVTQIAADTAKSAEELAKQARDIEVQTAQDALKTVDDLFKASAKAQQDRLKKQEQDIDKQAQRDKDANKRSLKSSKEQAAEEARIDAQAQEQKEALRQKDLELRRRAAIQEKASAIASIIINTQIGVAKVVGQTGVFGIPLSAFLYAQEALQIAAVLAQPLPAYEKGTNFAKGGLSRVSEKGSELVIEPSGKSYLTPETESIIDLKRGSKVIPAHQVQAMMGRPERIQNIGGVSVDLSELTGEQRESNRLLKKIADKRTIIQQGNGKFMRYRNSYFGKN